MTIYNKQTLATFFQTGDVPDGSDFQNLIDSQVNIVETSVQNMGGPLSTPELITSRVSAGNANFTGTVIVTTLSAQTAFADTLTVANSQIANLNANNVSAASLTVNAAIISGLGVTNALIATLSANTSYVTTQINPVAIISAAGTTQGAATLCTATICRLQGVVDGSTTGFLLMSNKTGLVQSVINETAASANLWPPTGGTINALGTNVPFGMAGSTAYTVIYKAASAYAVK